MTTTKKDSIQTTIDYTDDRSDIVRTTIIDRNGRSYTTDYKYDSKHNLIKTQDYRGLVIEYTYNAYGKEVTRKTYHKDNPNAYMFSEYAYQDDHFIKSESDSRYMLNGEKLKTSYQHDTTRNLLLKQTAVNGQEYHYSYDDKTDDLMSLASTTDNKTNENQFFYTRGYLTRVAHNGFNFGFTFDQLGRSKSVTVGDGTVSTALLTMSYEKDGVNDITETEFASGEKNTVTTDIFGNPILNTYTDRSKVTRTISNATYDSVGKVKQLVDNERGVCYNYTYDAKGNVTKIVETDKASGAILATNTFVFDANERLTSKTYGAVGQTYRPIYEKNASGHEYPDDVVVGIKLDGKFTDQTTKDGLGRVATRTLTVENIPLLIENYSYLKTSLASGKTIETAIVAGTTGHIGSTSANTSYTYDISGNIETVTVDSVLVAKYHYDKWNRIVREDNHKFGKTYTWEYDIGGNITEKRTYALCTGDAVSGEYTSDNYEYATSGWKDQLTSFNGEVCTYDALGNPTVYRGKTLEWTKVRRLAKFGDVEFTYNANGLRTSKTSNGVTKSYLLAGSSILQEKIGSNILKYYYGNGGIIGINYNDIDYFYRKNLQGDVIGIYTSSGAKVASYVYDAWGNHKIFDASGNEVTSTTHIGYINPIRYRGYYFDVETGLYYVSSRYYDPEIGRWINADSLLSQGSVLGNNMFAYCLNNPVNMADTTGELPFFLVTAAIGAVAGAIIGGVVAAKNGGNVWAGIGIGAAAGGLAGAGLGAAAGVVLAGSATASTAAVVSGAGMVATAVSTGGAGAGLALVADNISRAVNNVGTVLYSGGEQARQAATTFANNTGGTTIDPTVIGQVADAATKVPGADFTTVWSQASAAFCHQASGVVNAFVSNSAYRGIDSIFWSVEMPTLLNNPRVTEIIIHIFE